MCESCPFFDGFGCTRSPIANDGDELCICDADEVDEMIKEVEHGQR